MESEKTAITMEDINNIVVTICKMTVVIFIIIKYVWNKILSNLVTMLIWYVEEVILLCVR
jgi:hypothetical protein